MWVSRPGLGLETDQDHFFEVLVLVLVLASLVLVSILVSACLVLVLVSEGGLEQDLRLCATTTLLRGGSTIYEMWGSVPSLPFPSSPSSPPLPSLPSPSFPSPPFPPPLQFLPLPPPPFPPFPLEVGPLVAARGSGGALKLPQRVRAEPGRQTCSGAF